MNQILNFKRQLRVLKWANAFEIFSVLKLFVRKAVLNILQPMLAVKQKKTIFSVALNDPDVWA